MNLFKSEYQQYFVYLRYLVALNRTGGAYGLGESQASVFTDILVLYDNANLHNSLVIVTKTYCI